MQHLNTLFFLFFLLSQNLSAQALLSAQFLGNVSKAQLEQQFPQAFHNGVDRYRVTYSSMGLDGNPTVVSGLVCLPDDLTKRYPMVCYQHGTSSSPADVPSNLGFDATFPIALCGKGYVAFAPDYLGLGVSQGIHPYVHAASEAWVAVDLLRAAMVLAEQEHVAVSEQLFITGYSQGGHAAMAMHRMIEQELADEFTVTASAPMSGPYSIGEVMRDLIISGEEYTRPGYLINTIVSYQHVYGDLFSSIEEAFRPAYQDLVEDFFNGEITLGEVDVELADLLTANEGAIIPVKVIREEYLEAVENDPGHPANLRMIENNTYEWAPLAPTRLFYCTADEQVPFENSLLAESVMQANGAADVEAVLMSTTADHASCAFLAALGMLFFFEEYQVIEELPVATTEGRSFGLEVSPNPASDRIVLKNLPSDGSLRLFDLQGKPVLQRALPAGDAQLLLGGLPSGLYLLEFTGQQGSLRQKLVVR